MKRTELKDLKSKNLKDLIPKIHELRKELAETLIEKSLGKLKNTNKIRTKRQEIAQALTFFAQKKFESQLLEANKLQDKLEKQK